MSQRCDGLHFDRVSLLKGVVQDSRCVHHLPSEVAVVHVPHEQRLCGEGVRLYLDVCSRHLVHETGLANVWEATHQDGASVWIDGRESGKMLSHLLQVLEALILSLHDGAHTAQSSTLQLFATIERITKL